MIKLYFLLSKQYSLYYDSAGTLIATSYSTLLNWFKGRDGVTEVYDGVDVSELPCDPYKVFAVIGLNNIPNYIMADGTQPVNRIFGKQLGFRNQNLIELCNGVNIDVLCATPQIGSISVVSASCDMPTIGSITSTPVNSLYTPTDASPWIVDTGISSASKNGNQVNLTLKTTHTGQSGSLQATPIANLPSDIRPSANILITNSDQSQLPAGISLAIKVNGEVQWTGSPNSGTDTIQFSNIIYNL